MKAIVTVRRSAFTLVEVLVAAALAMFLMVIITGAFQAGLESFRQLKAVGEQMEKLRAAGSIIRRDLAMPHFSNGSKVWEGPYLRDQLLDDPRWEPPSEGFFRIVQGSPLVTTLGSNAPYRKDADGPIGEPPAFIAEDHALHFTVNVLGRFAENSPSNKYSELFTTRLKGPTLGDASTIDNFLKLSSPDAFIEKLDNSTGYPSGNFVSPWAEVAYYLSDAQDRIVDENQPGLQGPKLFTLRRRQRLAVMNPPTPTFSVPAGFPFQEISHADVPSQMYVNTPKDLAHPHRRWRGFYAGIPATLPPPSSPYQVPSDQLGIPANQSERLGDDVILTDVISFEIKPTWNISNDAALPPTHRTPPRGFVGGPAPNFDWPFDDLPIGDNPAINVNPPTSPRLFDTWSKENDPLFPTYLYQNNWDPKNAAGDRTFRIPLKIRVTALQIRIRIWDRKMQQARQITIVQDT